MPQKRLLLTSAPISELPSYADTIVSSINKLTQIWRDKNILFIIPNVYMRNIYSGLPFNIHKYHGCCIAGNKSYFPDDDRITIKGLEGVPWYLY